MPPRSKVLDSLAALGQGHLFDGWPEAGSEDAGKKLGEALRRTDAAYAGGLPAYVTKARALLEASQGRQPVRRVFSFHP